MQKEKTPKVTVCVITYNHEKYIQQCLRSIVDQVTDFDFVVLVGDDCSTDSTRTIAQIFVDKYPGKVLPIFRNKNIGSMNNFIAVLNIADGKYIALCEGDDYWLDRFKLQKQVDFLEANPNYSLCFHNALVNNIEKETQYPFNKKLSKKTFQTRDLILKPWFTPTASFVYRNNIKIPTWEGVNCDMVIVLVNSLHGNIYYLSEIMSVYNHGTLGSMSQKSTKKHLYYKKYNLLNCFDKYTNYKYCFYTYLIRIKITIGIFLNLFK
jgi:glycosyltransferase involved in cell wall biosynthesis